VAVDGHDLGSLGVYVLGGLDQHERRSVEEHLAGCEDCRRERADLEQMRAALEEVPPEAFLHGPPEGGDLLLQRTLREVRRESARRALQRGGLVAAAAAAIVAVALAGGVLLGRGQQQPPPPVARPAPSALPTPPPGTRVASVVDPATGARMTVRVVPAAGWVRVTAAVSGIPEGQRCRLWVVARDGARQLAGSWLVSATGARDGVSLDGSALVAPADVAAVQVDNVDGRPFVTAPL
jgi:hypothetical protein